MTQKCYKGVKRNDKSIVIIKENLVDDIFLLTLTISRQPIPLIFCFFVNPVSYLMPGIFMTTIQKATLVTC